MPTDMMIVMREEKRATLGRARPRRWLVCLVVVIAVLSRTAMAAPSNESWSRSTIAEQLRTNTLQAVANNTWPQHLVFLDKAVLDLFAQLPKLAANQRYRQLVNDETASMALAQSAFLRRVTPDTAGRSLLLWLFSNRSALEEFCEAIKEQDHLPRVLQLWSELWEADPKTREKYWNLALACALVFDRPVPKAGSMRERYEYFRDSAEAGQLCVPLAELAPWELIWVVDAPVPTSELIWARKNVKLARSQWGQAFGMIQYRMDRALKGAKIYDEYTLAEIRQKGGVCIDQAYFAAITAKANGIPAMIFTGEGERGGHAWFGFKASPQEWNFKTGRYQGDKLVAGFVTDPQTRETIKEQTLYLLTDPQRRQSSYREASRLTWLADIFDAHGQPDAAREALEQAVALSSRHLAAWKALYSSLKKSNQPTKKLQDTLAAMRANFRAYPDVVATINEWEIAVLMSGTNTAELVEAMRQQHRQLQSASGDRTDLLVSNVKQRAAIFEQRNDPDGADGVYRRALAEEGRQLTAFAELVAAYAEFARKHGRLSEAVRNIYTELRRHPVPGGDPFAQRMYAQIQRRVADLLEENNQPTQAKTLRQEAAQREQRAASQGHR